MHVSATSTHIRYDTHTHLAGRGRGDTGIWRERFVPLGWPVAHTLALILSFPKARPQKYNDSGQWCKEKLAHMYVQHMMYLERKLPALASAVKVPRTAIG